MAIGSFRLPVGGSSVSVSYDPDAEAFFTATLITNTTQKSAINTLVLDLKSYGIWTKMKAIYPMVSDASTSALRAEQHKYNLKDPRDLNAAFRLSFIGGWTHSGNGALPNGSTGYADTFLVPNTDLTLNGAGISYYTREFKTAGYPNKGAIMGSGGGSSELSFFVDYAGTDYIANNNAESTGTQLSGTRGFFHNTRIISTGYNVYRNGIVRYNFTSASSSRTTSTITIARILSNPGDYTNVECSFSAIDTGLTDNEAANFYTAVQAFQTTLSRQV